MTFYKQIEHIFPYLKSVRKLKGYLSFDVEIPNTWKIPKKFIIPERVVDQQKTENNMRLISFIAEFNENEVNTTTQNINSIIEYNKELEEKELLFINKVDELKKIFERQDLNKLQTLKFELKEFNLSIEDEEPKTNTDRVVTE